MEPQQLISFPFVFAFLLFMLMLVKRSKKIKIQNYSLPLPPGPSKLPLIGHLHHLLGLPHHSLRNLAKIHGPLMHLKLGEVSAVVISSPSVAKQMMKTDDLMFVDRPQNLATKIMSYNGGDVIMAPYGEYWRQVRKICILELLSPKRVQSFWAVREEEVSNLIGTISLMVGSPMNLSKNIFTLTNDITARAAFGKTCKDKQAFITVMKEVVKLASGFAIADLFPSLSFLEMISGTKPKLERIHQKVDNMLDDIIREHKENRIAVKNLNEEVLEEDLVDVLLRLQEGGELEFPITMDNVKAITLVSILMKSIYFTMFDGMNKKYQVTAGILQLFCVLNSYIHHCSGHVQRRERYFINGSRMDIFRTTKKPKSYEKAQAEVRRIFHGKKKIHHEDMTGLNYLRLVIKESLGLHPPAPLLVPRECRERCEMDGYEIPKGSKVIVNAWAIGRDPEQWRDPESFEPERFEDKSIDYKGTNFKIYTIRGWQEDMSRYIVWNI
ncbi:hypothetical protein IFM89_000233 [Coptis chinensis]|uniref:Cytochrome P450 n=1 Tax=Coptis chinensis TaxID=261450 RepID=A0A835I4L0_9MAGN|nr:hypothetical protein IFM89_000233 [Coptis chinensis]